MPTEPYQSQVLPTVGPSPNMPTLSPQDYGAGLGDSLYKIGAHQKAKADAAAVDQALLDLDEHELQLMLGDDGFMKKSGLLAGQSIGPTISNYETKRKALLEGLTGRQKAEFDRLSRVRRVEVASRVMKRGHIESETAYADLYNQGAQSSVNRSLDAALRGGVQTLSQPDGTLAFSHPAIDADRAVRHAQIESYAKGHALELGVTDETKPVEEWDWVKVEKAKDDSVRTAAVVQGLLSSHQDVAARAYFEQHESSIIDPDVRLHLESETSRVSLEGMIERAAGDVVDNATAADEAGNSPSEEQISERVKASLDAVPDENKNAVRDRTKELMTARADEITKKQSATYDELHSALQDGMPMKTIETLPQFQAGLSPDQRDALRKYNKNRGDYVATDPETWTRLEKLRKENPSALLSVNTRQLTDAGLLASEDAKEVESWKDTFSKAANGDPEAADAIKLSMTRQQTREAWAKKANLSENGAIDFELALKDQERRAVRAKGAALTDEEYDTLVQRATIKVVFDRPWYSGGDVTGTVGALSDEGLDELLAHPESVEFDDIPPADVEEFRAALVGAGVAADDESLKLEWIRYMRRLRATGQ